MRQVLSDCRVFTGEEIIHDHEVEIDNGCIIQVAPLGTISRRIKRRSLANMLLAPGFIDTQVNGGTNALFNHAPSIDTIRKIGREHRQHGTTGFLPTLVSDSEEQMVRAINATKQALQIAIPGVLGIHLEGPYLNKERRGIHPELAIRNPDKAIIAILESEKEAGKILLTVAPEELPDGLIARLSQAGIIISAGHTNATYEQTKSALQQGVRGFTHLFNAMAPLQSRSPGTVGAALDDPKSYCSIIADMHHVHAATLKIAIAAKPKGKMMLVTDAIHSVGSDNTHFTLLNERVSLNDGKVTNAYGTLAGSNLTMAQAVRNCVSHLQLDLPESLRMASLYPARFLKLSHRLGRIKAGYSADMVLLDDKQKVVNTWVAGSSATESPLVS